MYKINVRAKEIIEDSLGREMGIRTERIDVVHTGGAPICLSGTWETESIEDGTTVSVLVKDWAGRESEQHLREEQKELFSKAKQYQELKSACRRAREDLVMGNIFNRGHRGEARVTKQEGF